MAPATDFQAVYSALREIMIPYADELIVVRDQPGSLYLDTHHVMKNKKPLFFGAVEIKKRYVSYHLMPIYVGPSLLDDVSDELRKRMQGKSCLNFVKTDPNLFAELGELTAAGYKFYKQEGYS